MKKKIMAVLLACTLAIGTAAGPAGPVMAWTVQGSEVAAGFEGLDNNGTISITRYVGNGTEVTVPGSVNGTKVQIIGKRAFVGSNVKSIVIQGVEYIGDEAFFECGGLESVSISEGTKYILADAFNGCGRLESVSIPVSVEAINRRAFYGTPWLAEQLRKGNGLAIVNHMVIDAEEDLSGGIIIPEGVTRIADDAFSDCNEMEGVSIPKGVTSIGMGAFYGCSGLKSVSIPEGVVGIGINAFAGCHGLEDVSIPEGVRSINNYAFYGCGRLKSVSIPGSVIGIFSSAFSGCRGLESVSISEGVQSIFDGAFSGCGGLKSVSIPASVTSIGSYAFGECDNLKDVHYAGSPEQWEKIAIESENDVLLSANIHYNSVGAEDPGTENPGDPGTENPKNPDSGIGTLPVQKSAQSITGNDNMIKTYGAKAFSLGAKSSGGTTLSYEVSDPKVATVDASGKVTVKGCGMTNITITAAETEKYKKAQKTVRLTVKPKKAALSSVKSKKKKTAEIKWKRNKEASGYIIQCATDKKFKKNKTQAEVSKNKTLSKTMKKLKGGKCYYVRVCAYAKSGNRKIQGDWSKAKTVKVKK